MKRKSLSEMEPEKKSKLIKLNHTTNSSADISHTSQDADNVDKIITVSDEPQQERKMSIAELRTEM